MSVNKVILVGHLGTDPELRYTQSGSPVTNFRLATNERWTGQDGQANERTTWHNIVVWGKQAEIAHKYLSKGREIYLEGRIQTREYDDKEGNKKTAFEIVLSSLQFLGRGNRSDGGAAEEGDDKEVLPF